MQLRVSWQVSFISRKGGPPYARAEVERAPKFDFLTDAGGRDPTEWLNSPERKLRCWRLKRRIDGATTKMKKPTKVTKVGAIRGFVCEPRQRQIWPF